MSRASTRPLPPANLEPGDFYSDAHGNLYTVPDPDAWGIEDRFAQAQAIAELLLVHGVSMPDEVCGAEEIQRADGTTFTTGYDPELASAVARLYHGPVDEPTRLEVRADMLERRADLTDDQARRRQWLEKAAELAEEARVERAYMAHLTEVEAQKARDAAELEAEVRKEARRSYTREMGRRRASEMIDADTPMPDLVEYSLDDLLSAPPLEWWVDGILPKGGLTLIAGTGGVGKSALLVDMSLRMAADRSFLDTHATRIARVLYVAGEGVSGYGQRFQAAQKEHGIRVPADSIRLVADGFKLSDARQVERLTKRITEGRFDVVILDTLSSLSTIESENDNAEAARLMNAARSLVAGRPGASVIVVHHVNKESGTLRGASAFRDNVDAVWVLKGDRDSFSMSSRPADGGKMKDGGSDVIRGLSLKEAHGSVVVEHSVLADVQGKRTTKLDQAREAVRACAARSLSRAELSAVIRTALGTDITTKAVGHHLESLKAEGVIIPTGRGQYTVKATE